MKLDVLRLRSVRERVLAGLLGLSILVAALVVWRDRPGYDVEAMVTCQLPQVRDTPSVEDVPTPEVRLEQVSDLSQGTAMAVWPDGRAAVAGRLGEVWLLAEDGGPPEVAIDITDRMVLGDEGGLIGFAVDERRQKAYLHVTDEAGSSVILELGIDDAGRVDMASERELLVQPHPGRVHNGGAIRIGPDGYLYIGFGDGGGRAVDAERVRSLEHWDGKILRIDPDPLPDAPYRVPSDNPFVDHDGARPEIWLRGMRNPYQMSFDETGALWVADVGELCHEEITKVPPGDAGVDLGFPSFEGAHGFMGGDADEVLFPLYTYEHSASCAVIGGHVVTDRALADMAGAYVFGDLCTGVIQTIRQTVDGLERSTLADTMPGVQAFGQDAADRSYVLGVTGVFRLVPGP